MTAAPRACLLLLTLAALSATQAADPVAVPAQADRFEVEAATSLKKSAAEKRGIELIVGGERVVGYVIAIGPDSIILTSREHGRIVVRRDRIDAVIGE
jgi:hypothetical protein